MDRNDPIVRALANSFHDIVGQEPKYAGTHGWCDAALLGAAGIPTVIFGPAGAGAHAAEEYVQFTSVVQGAAVLAETIVRYCGIA